VSETVITQEGFEKLRQDLEQLESERQTLVDRIRRALENGGAFPENGEYLDARHELELLDRRLARLEARARTAEVVYPEQDGVVDVGESVTVLDVETGETIDYTVVGSGEADPVIGDVSHESPVGAALLGSRVGDVVEVAVPTGARRLEVVEVDG
jgi:transcription elongation factor GreA